MAYTTIIVETHGRTGLIRLNRPEALNAINRALTDEFLAAAKELDDNSAIGCIVVTGSQKAFASGADIKEMQDQGFMDMYQSNWFAPWQQFAATRTPTIAAVSGYALGGGCELAMMCDFILASDTAKFGQPEIKLGVIPGMGGSQRLTRLVGRAKSMEMCLTGRLMDAEEAERAGLVSRIIASEKLLEEALKTADTIANMSLPVAMMAKEAVARADEVTLQEGLLFERRLFHSLFALEDQKEGMKAFVEKRQPDFKNR